MSTLAEQIEGLRRKLSAYRTLQELGEDHSQEIQAAEAELQALIIQTEGGAVIGGDVHTGGGPFVGRDQILATLADGSVIIGGNAQGVIVITGDNNQVTLAAEQVPLNTLLQMYYRSLALECSRLPLGIVDAKFNNSSSFRQDEVSLSQVYTDLDVVSPPADESQDPHTFGFRLARGLGKDRTPLLEAVASPQARLLVLVGDPGSGKTTFTNYLTFLLANALSLGQSADLPEPLNELLPVRLVLRQAAKHFPADTHKGSARFLWQAFFAEVTERIGTPAAAQLFPYLQAKLEQQGGLFLLDGLDEVPEADRRRKCMLEAIHQLAGQIPAKSRILLTARPYAYADPAWRLPNFQLLALAPFSPEQIERFVKGFYRAVGPVLGWDEPTTHERGNRLTAGILAKEYLADLASRPLLLTLMATLDSSWGKLPEDRADLFEESVKLLLTRWQRVREVRNERGELDWEPSISKALGLGEDKIRAALEKLAYQVHLRQAFEPNREHESADISRGEVLEVFCEMLPEDFNADVLLKYLETRSGLLVGRRENVYAFPHRSFQEYLTACHLMTVEQNVSLKLRELVYSDLDWWREVFLLGVGKKRQGGLGDAVGMVQTLVPGEIAFAGEITEKDYLAAILAAQALIELRLKERMPGESSFQTVVERICRWLVRIVEEGLLIPAQRLEAADALGTLGDPRFDEKRLHLPAFLRGTPEPHLGFVLIPAGTFIMGSDKNIPEAYEDEKPVSSVPLPDFYISRYPVTNAQYAHFIQAGGYQNERYWTLEGWAWRNGQDYDLSLIDDVNIRNIYQEVLKRRPPERRSLPFWWNDPRWSAPTRPVVGVCWYEAMAYCRWLDEQLRALHPELFRPGYVVRLPSEAEWEKAARGSAGRTWAWGNQWQEDCANVDETGLGQTSPVGMFPRGCTPETGVFDLTGNVWEWTHTRWGRGVALEYPYPWKSDDGRENPQGVFLRVIRGGSWNFSRRNARCAFRDWGFPNGFDDDFGFRCVVSLAFSES